MPALRRTVRSGTNPNEEVATEVMLNISPAELGRRFLAELLTARWIMESFCTIMDDREEFSGLSMMSALATKTIHEFTHITMELMEQNGEDPEAFEKEAFAAFLAKLGENVKSTRRMTAAEHLAREALAGVDPTPSA